MEDVGHPRLPSVLFFVQEKLATKVDEDWLEVYGYHFVHGCAEQRQVPELLTEAAAQIQESLTMAESFDDCLKERKLGKLEAKEA